MYWHYAENKIEKSNSDDFYQIGFHANSSGVLGKAPTLEVEVKA